MKPEIKAEGNPENLQDTEVKQQSKKKKKKSMDQRGKKKKHKEEIKGIRIFCKR